MRECGLSRNHSATERLKSTSREKLSHLKCGLVSSCPIPLDHRAQVPLDSTTEIEPVPSDAIPRKAEENLPPRKLPSSVRSWIDQGAPGRLRLQGIDYEELKGILCKLDNLGIRTRFDWDNESRTAVIRGLTELHKEAESWFGDQVAPLIKQKIEQVAICGRPSISIWGSEPLRVGSRITKDQSRLTPDHSLSHMHFNTNEILEYVSGVSMPPRVIFEIVESECYYLMIEKVFKYLYDMIGVHTVVLCTMTNIPYPTNSGAELAKPKPFKAGIEVWTRKADGLVGDHKLAEDLITRPDFEPNHADASSLVPAEFKDRAGEYFRPDPNNPDRKQRIYRRSSEIVLCDESVPTGQEKLNPELILSVYDVLRPCRRFPDRYIRDRDVVIPLKDIRRSLMSALEDRRELLQQHQARDA
ncbi:hypothetical protein RSOLAG22IIIB_08654 [Rhizoctonia solani]|uniref:Uncharacterized protein n=1 Tax=Rhizoctonia solani TaxID=456999 RepID=A0A0K6FU93_9AGAM|nr:hypothetical protein RSOLAG22IIIB_08654 [Rhizoctonia solani]